MKYDKIFKNIEPDQKFSKSEKEWLDTIFLMFLTIRQQIRIRNSEENN